MRMAIYSDTRQDGSWSSSERSPEDTPALAAEDGDFGAHA